MEGSAPAGERMLASVLEHIRGTANVDVVFGETRIIGEKAVIPVATVSYGFGAGSGEGPSPAAPKDGALAWGGGGGGGVRVKPIAALEITAQKTRLIPIIDVTKIITRAMLLCFTMCLIRQLKKRPR